MSEDYANGTKKYEIIVYGKPQGKGRPRFARRGKYVHTYTPKETLDYEEKFSKAWKEKGYPKLEGPVQVEVYASMYIPKNTSKKQRELMLKGEIKPTKKPDIDNISKVVLDAINGVAWTDDNQVVVCYTRKLYDEKPYVLVRVRELKED